LEEPSSPEQPSRPVMANPSRLPLLHRLDELMASGPWVVRFLPYLVYVGMLLPVSELRELLPATYLLTYSIQCGLVAWLLWRYRALLPESTLSFHWAAVPVGVVVAVAWIWLGLWMVEAFPERYADQRTNSDMFKEMGLGIGWVAFSMRLLGMSILVPLFEELFVRSMLLRGLSSFRLTAIGVVQTVIDIPVIGEWLMHTRLGDRADAHSPSIFRDQFNNTPLGALTLLGVAASTLAFTMGHGQRDWPGAVMCGVVYCLLLAATRHKGLGPVCWAHGITNALLWVYTLVTDDWQFL